MNYIHIQNSGYQHVHQRYLIYLSRHLLVANNESFKGRISHNLQITMFVTTPVKIYYSLL